MLVSQLPSLHGQCVDAVYSSDDDDALMDSPPASYRRRRFFKSGLSTYEEMYSRNATGRRLGRYSLQGKLKADRPTIMSSCGGPQNDTVDTSMQSCPTSKQLLRRRSASDSEMDDPASDEFKQRSSSFNDMMQRASNCPEVMRPTVIATDEFSFFRRRSGNPRRGGSSLTSSPTRASNASKVSPENKVSDTKSDVAVRANCPLDPVDATDETELLSPLTHGTAPRDSTSTLHPRESHLHPRDSSFCASNDGSTSYQPVAIRNSVSNNMNVVRFVSGYKKTKSASALHPRGHGSASTRSSLDGRSSVDSVRKSARYKKQGCAMLESGLNKKLHDARNRIPLEFRDELSHLLEKPYVAKPKTTQKSVHFNADANRVLVFEWESDDSSSDSNDDNDVEAAAVTPSLVHL
ncbi:hypothetical protein DYB32_000390 [Aphanomyces invadans]|uniref:Uncharacterized protein n=1 Tax=Aphanomyces invadans TaxID=157072 RepID=A0A3R6YGV4_9STRA|nr:hypothetical protein DYB32_000390 [Aphanomyces invadans]